MKITKQQLRRIIQEELNAELLALDEGRGKKGKRRRSGKQTPKNPQGRAARKASRGEISGQQKQQDQAANRKAEQEKQNIKAMQGAKEKLSDVSAKWNKYEQDVENELTVLQKAIAKRIKGSSSNLGYNKKRKKWQDKNIPIDMSDDAVEIKEHLVRIIEEELIIEALEDRNDIIAIAKKAGAWPPKKLPTGQEHIDDEGNPLSAWAKKYDKVSKQTGVHKAWQDEDPDWIEKAKNVEMPKDKQSKMSGPPPLAPKTIRNLKAVSKEVDNMKDDLDQAEEDIEGAMNDTIGAIDGIIKKTGK